MGYERSELEFGIQSHWLVRHLLKNGLQREQIEQQLQQEVDDSASLFLPIQPYLQLFEWAADVLDEPHLGLKLARNITPGDLGLFGYLMRNAPDIRAMIWSLEHYQSIFMRGMEFQFIESGHTVELVWHASRTGDVPSRIDTEFSLAAFIQAMRNSIGEHWQPDYVAFNHDAVEPSVQYNELLADVVHFKHGRNCVRFSADVLALPISDNDPDLLAILSQQADTALNQLMDRRDLVAQVRFLISAMMEDSSVTAERVAAQLHITTRTLNRRLKQADTSYQRLREEVMSEVASRALSESNASITEIASKMGYTEPSSFVRAFKRITGVTPNAYRTSRASIVSVG